MSQTRNRGRMSQCETTCKILRALGAGRWTAPKIATFAGVSLKTVRRYLSVLSIYFGVHEHQKGHDHFYWLDDHSPGLTVRGNVPERFCKRGHDKYAAHGGYYHRYPQGVYLCCAVCSRARNNASYQRIAQRNARQRKAQEIAE